MGFRGFQSLGARIDQDQQERDGDGEDCCSFLSPVCFSGEKCLAAAAAAAVADRASGRARAGGV